MKHSIVYQLPITFISDSRDLAKSTYTIAQEANITYYDACFIALAQQEKAILITDNIKHQGRASGIKVIALKDY